MVRPKTPSAPISSTISIGISSSLQVPAVGVRDHAVVGEAAELVADHLVVVVEAGGAEAGGALGGAHQLDEAGAGGGRCCPRRSGARPRGCGRRRARRAPRPRSCGRTISPCDIGMPPASWARYSPAPICRISALGLAEGAGGGEARGPRRRAGEGLGVGGRPGEARGRRTGRPRARALEMRPPVLTRAASFARAAVDQRPGGGGRGGGARAAGRRGAASGAGRGRLRSCGGPSAAHCAARNRLLRVRWTLGANAGASIRGATLLPDGAAGGKLH